MKGFFPTIVLLSAVCAGCTFVSTVRMSAALADSSHPLTPASEAVGKYAEWLTGQGMEKADPATFGKDGHYNLHIYEGRTGLGFGWREEYVNVYAGDAQTIVIELTRISDDQPSHYSDQEVETVRMRTVEYLKKATGDTYNVVVVQHN